MADSPKSEHVKRKRKTNQKPNNSPSRQPFTPPETVQHLSLPNDTIQYICIHYGTEIKAIKALNPTADSSFRFLPTCLVVPWPTSIEAPCKKCTGHVWCHSIHTAMTKNRKVKQTNITSQEELKKIVLQKVHDLLKRSTTNLTYSRIKAALEEKYGHLLVSSIKSEIQDILQSFAEDHDRRNRLEPAAEDKDAKPDDDFAAMFETTVLHTKIPQSDAEADDDSNNSDSECNDDAPQTPQKPRSPPNNTGPHTSPLSTPKDPKLLHLELQNWETEMQKLDQNDENDMMLRQMLQKKIDVIQETLSKSGDLLGKKSSSYLSNFDAKFSKLKIQAEKSVICEGERACTCCGRPLFAGAKVPEGCAYQDDLGTELKPKPSPVVITSLPRTDNRQSSGLLSSREDEDMFEL